MSDEAKPSDKPEEEAAQSREEESQYREIPPKVKRILEDHAKWVEPEGEESTVADFTKANLQRADLVHANLQRASLFRANLQGAYLFRTNLQGGLPWGSRAPAGRPRGGQPRGS